MVFTINRGGRRVYRSAVFSLISSVVLVGCSWINLNGGSSDGKDKVTLPDKTVVKELPTFTKRSNEVEVASDMSDIDPTWVLGAIVDTRTGVVRGLDSYLSKDAKPTVTPQAEVVFKDFIENSLTANASWLSFLQAQVTDSVRAELSVVKTMKVTIKNADVDKNKLVSELRKIPVAERGNYALVIGYIDFVLSAGLFKNVGTDDSASGYGAKIGGKWYSKSENSVAQHRVIAIWSPLPFAVSHIENAAGFINLEKATAEAIRRGDIAPKELREAYIKEYRM